MAVGVTISKPAGVPYVIKDNNSKVAVRDIVLDTGTYVTNGFSVTAASVGLKTIDLIRFGSQVMTNGTAAVSANPLGVVYASNRQSVTITEYESAAANVALAEKTNAEANAANCTCRVEFVSYA